MCGIVGAIAFNHLEDAKRERVRQDSMIYMTSELLQLTQPRGKEATGLAVSFEDGTWMGLKMGVAATDFISRFGDTEQHYNKFVDGWRKKGASRMVIGHCRKPSIGGNAGPEDNKNNHPIKVGETVGVHNGTLTNHEEIFKSLNCGRDGKVDSEAIFRLVNHYTKNGEEPFTKEMVLEVCKRITGGYACLTFNANNPFQMAAFRDGRPMEIAIIRPLKLAIIASEKDYLKRVVFDYNKQAHLYQSAKSKFVELHKDDVDFETMSDNSLFVFDTNTDIVPDTKISELYESEKIPRTGKLWTKAVKTVVGVGNSNWNSNNQNSIPARTTTPHTEVSVNPNPAGSSNAPSGQNTPTKGILGMVMNRNSHRFESKVGLDETKKHSNVILDTEDMTAKDVITGEEIGLKKKEVIALQYNQNQSAGHSSTTRFEFENTDADLDDLITDPAKVSEIVINNLSRKTDDEVINIVPEKTVDMSVDAEALADSIEAAKADKNFSTDVDVVNVLDIISISTLNQMSLYSLANKVKKWAFQRGWYAGYLVGKSYLANNKESSEGFTPIALLKRYRNKAKSGQDVIKSLKILLRVLGTLSEGVSDDLVNTTTKSVISSVAANIDLEALNKVIKATDINNAPVIKKVLEKINDKEFTR